MARTTRREAGSSQKTCAVYRFSFLLLTGFELASEKFWCVY